MEKAFIENERTNLSKSCKVGDVVRERDMASAEE